MFKKLTLFLTILLIASNANAGPLAYAACQTVCNGGAVACYAAAGFTFGTVTVGLGTPLVILGCNAALGVCMVACSPLLVLHHK
ncbi:hypothetical protein PVAND_011975 [Polypedilum vanderplanki]|uniref:Cysteine-rich protein n=1 Tax=Polypedilum vanderplanki TaxID=319348 RepID=A0A9J6CKY4_POLVA|nr:hypothetical protein PVAND_011975 [Polypedilum vanderplanki]